MGRATPTSPTRRTTLGVLAMLGALGGCRPGADDILATAQLEEIQHNPVHARELYTDIVRRYPDTPQAATAAARLEALAASGTPAPRHD